MKHAILSLILLISTSNFAQDPVFTQFYANPIYLNPALAGSHGCPRLNINHRNQWPSLSGAFITNSVSYDQYVNALHGGLAVMVTNDMAGKNTINWNTINLAYSYHLQVTRKFSLLFGAQATWNQKFIDWNKLAFGDEIDPRRGFVFQTNDLPRGRLTKNNWGTRGFFDVSAGVVGYSDNFYCGFAAKHLNRPNESMIIGDSKMPMRFTAHAGANIDFKKKSQYQNNASISPNVIFTYQNGFKQYNVGTYVNFGALTAGAWYRFSENSDAVIMTIGLRTGSFNFGYSYDVTVSKLTNASGGAHEMSIGFNFACKEKLKKFRMVSCPSF